MAIPELSGFNLAGGTALALQIGHRKSVDLDFFGASPIDKDEIVTLLESVGNLHILQHSRNILIFNINGIKVDFVFDDAEEDDELVLFEKATWPEVKQTIEAAVKEILR
jgi:hypothetical protein